MSTTSMDEMQQLLRQSQRSQHTLHEPLVIVDAFASSTESKEAMHAMVERRVIALALILGVLGVTAVIGMAVWVSNALAASGYGL